MKILYFEIFFKNSTSLQNSFFFLNNRILNKISENYDYKINIKWQLKKFQKIFSQIRESINND